MLITKLLTTSLKFHNVLSALENGLATVAIRTSPRS